MTGGQITSFLAVQLTSHVDLCSHSLFYSRGSVTERGLWPAYFCVLDEKIGPERCFHLPTFRGDLKVKARLSLSSLHAFLLLSWVSFSSTAVQMGQVL